MGFTSFKSAIQGEIDGLNTNNALHWHDAIENLATLAENHLQDADLILSAQIERRLHNAFLQIVGCRKISPKAWDNFNNMTFSYRNRVIAETAYREVLGMLPS